MKELFVTVPPSLQALLTEELHALGIPKIRQGFSGVFVPKEMEWVYRINYCSRLATRVLWPFAQFQCRDRDDLYHNVFRLYWPEIFSLDQSFAIDANVSSTSLRHSLFASQVMKDALCDRFRKEKGARPSVKTDDPDIQLNLFIHDEMATLSFDTSGAPLYKRGWRKDTVAAPLQESLAAAALLLAGFPQDVPLLDPFCGSGTILIEAAHIKTHTPPGFFRTRFGFFHHPDFSKSAWEKVKKIADAKRTTLEKGMIFGIDKDPKAISFCQKNLKNAGLEDLIEVHAKDIRSYFPKTPPELIVTNPPYGKRMKSSAELYQAFGNFVREKCDGKIAAHVLCPEKSLIQETHLRIVQETSLVSGGLDLTLFQLTKS